jgi:K+-sensing histidine kinase KdpD
MPAPTTSDELLSSLVHDLRQPLGNIETSVFCLDLVLNHPQGRVREQLRTIEQQVAQATRLLHLAAGELRRLQGQRSTDTAGSFDRTKPANAAVT